MTSNVFDLRFFAPTFFKVKDYVGNIVPFKFNRAQEYIHSRLEAQREAMGWVRALILKGRQQGCSTYVQGRYCHKVITGRGKKAFILTHEVEATQNLFDITKRYIEHLPDGLIPTPDKSSHNKLYFNSLDSGYSIGTARNASTGRSQTVQLFHGSEVAFWHNADELAKGVMQTIFSGEGTEIILESTANGMGNYFHQLWQSAQAGLSEFQAIFVPWYWQDNYIDNSLIHLTEEESLIFESFKDDGLTIPHLAWRRRKINQFTGDEEQKLEKFKQEYPMTANEAFINPVDNRFINSTHVLKARKEKVTTESPLIIGVDPAISDKDRCVIIRRKGRLAFDTEVYYNQDTMQIAGRIRNIITKENPAKVYIDSIGIGAGIVDRLKEQGCDCVEGIAVSRKASDPDKFRNLRAELWHDMREWLLQDSPVQIPDDDELHAELTSLGFHYDSSGRLVIESKEDLKKRGLRSPDKADALALTFAGGEFVSTSAYQPTFIPRHAFGMFT